MSPGLRPSGLSATSSVGVLSLVMLSLLNRPVSEAAWRSTPAGVGGTGRADVVNAQSVAFAMPA